MMRKILILLALLLQFHTTQAQEVYVAKYKGDKQCAISYTFDDGLAEQATMAAPELEKRGFRGTFFLNPSKINGPHKQKTDTTRMSWEQVKTLHAAGHEIANHGWAHRNFGKFSTEEIIRDIDMGDSAIVANIGFRPVSFAYPNNTKTGDAMAYVVKDRVGTRTFQQSVGGKRKTELHKWLDKTLQEGSWLVGMTHGLTYGYDAFIDPSPFWQHLDEVKAMEDKIWVGTFAEVAAYIAERDAVTLDVRKNKKGIKVTPSCTLDPKLFREKLTLVVQLDDGGKKLVELDPFGKPVTIKLK